MFATYRAKVEHIIFMVKIVIQEDKNFFLPRQFQSFEGSSVRIKSEKTLYLYTGLFNYTCETFKCKNILTYF